MQRLPRQHSCNTFKDAPGFYENGTKHSPISLQYSDWLLHIIHSKFLFCVFGLVILTYEVHNYDCASCFLSAGQLTKSVTKCLLHDSILICFTVEFIFVHEHAAWLTNHCMNRKCLGSQVIDIIEYLCTSTLNTPVCN